MLTLFSHRWWIHDQSLHIKYVLEIKLQQSQIIPLQDNIMLFLLVPTPSLPSLFCHKLAAIQKSRTWIHSRTTLLVVLSGLHEGRTTTSPCPSRNPSFQTPVAAGLPFPSQKKHCHSNTITSCNESPSDTLTCSSSFCSPLAGPTRSW